MDQRLAVVALRIPCCPHRWGDAQRYEAAVQGLVHAQQVPGSALQTSREALPAAAAIGAQLWPAPSTRKGVPSARFQPDQLPIPAAIGEHIEQAVRALPHVANA